MKYKCIVSKNGKRYYKNVSGKWKRITNKVGEKAEKGKNRYRMEGGEHTDFNALPGDIIDQELTKHLGADDVARLSGVSKGLHGILKDVNDDNKEFLMLSRLEFIRKDVTERYELIKKIYNEKGKHMLVLLLKTVPELINDVINIRKYNRDHYWSLLRYAIVDNNVDLVEIIVENGGDVNEISWNYTPLNTASRIGNLEIARFLLREGANPNTRTSPHGAVPLHYAGGGQGIEYPDHLEIVRLLLENGADKTIRHNRPGNPNALEIAQTNRGGPGSNKDEIIKLLSED